MKAAARAPILFAVTGIDFFYGAQTKNCAYIIASPFTDMRAQMDNAESAHGPRMMSIGLHPRILGRPGRARALKLFFDDARQYPDVWFARREDTARAWLS
jgi:hypothetical protein